ncbi:hypothetical protein JHK82_037396 [Glycine max]|nr:hypothetical protein JHK85_038149 [Glycine max]KAG4978119.1 hypothetical protein JHK86_037593 [Glycine max]KAG5114127.1 hypothetical protein JHK82_037396 [Glycine max]KAG5131405.1 hypothetical protein JHK84_037802 [Glycine max]
MPSGEEDSTLQATHQGVWSKQARTMGASISLLHMARLNSVLLITLLVLVSYSSVLDARKILKIETQEMLSLKGTPPSIEATSYHKRGSGRLVAHLSNEEVVSNPSPGEGH